jgi:hypothetical protein
MMPLDMIRYAVGAAGGDGAQRDALRGPVGKGRSLPRGRTRPRGDRAGEWAAGQRPLCTCETPRTRFPRYPSRYLRSLPSHRVLLLFFLRQLAMFACEVEQRKVDNYWGQVTFRRRLFCYRSPRSFATASFRRLNLVPHFILFLSTLSSLYGFPAGPAPLENRARGGAAQAHFHIQDRGASPHDGARAAHAAVPGGTGV